MIDLPMPTSTTPLLIRNGRNMTMSVLSKENTEHYLSKQLEQSDGHLLTYSSCSCRMHDNKEMKIRNEGTRNAETEKKKSDDVRLDKKKRKGLMSNNASLIDKNDRIAPRRDASQMLDLKKCYKNRTTNRQTCSSSLWHS